MSALKEGDRQQTNIKPEIEGIKEFLEKLVRKIEDSYNALETTCVNAINSIATQTKDSIN